MRWLSRFIAAGVLVGAGMTSAMAAAIPGLGASAKVPGANQVQNVRRRGFGRRGFGRRGFGGLGLYVGPGWGAYDGYGYDDDYYDYGPSYYYPSYRYRRSRRRRGGRRRGRR